MFQPRSIQSSLSFKDKLDNGYDLISLDGNNREITLIDVDRGVVIGRSTFGKGLVQTVINIDRERSVKITSAKYSIPSGRLIQKPGYLPKELLADTAFSLHKC